MNKTKHKRPWPVFLAIFSAVFIGSWLGSHPSPFAENFYGVVDVLGKIFLNALMLVVVPLVSSSIITGISRIGNEGAFGRLGAKMVLFYLGTSLMAILIGLSFVNLLQPGIGTVSPEAMAGSIDLSALQEKMGQTGPNAFVEVLISIVPSNIIAAFSRGEMLGLIFFSIIFGYALSKIEKENASTLKSFFQGIFQTMIQVTHIIMKALPYGVFCLVSKVFMERGLESLGSVALFSLTVLLGFAAFMFIALPLLLKFVAGVNPIRTFKAMMPALVTAFSTSSSSASLPITIDCVEKRAGVSNRVCSLVIPLGTSLNMSGSALYECVAAMFVAQAYGIEMSFLTQFIMVFMTLITSMGVAGIPSGSIIATMIILKIMGLPLEGIGLFVAVDRILDMCRTTVNVFSDSCCAVFVAKSEGETGVLQSDVFEEDYA